jgi:hypothetical protein
MCRDRGGCGVHDRPGNLLPVITLSGSAGSEMVAAHLVEGKYDSLVSLVH